MVGGSSCCSYGNKRLVIEGGEERECVQGQDGVWLHCMQGSTLGFKGYDQDEKNR